MRHASRRMGVRVCSWGGWRILYPEHVAKELPTALPSPLVYHRPDTIAFEHVGMFGVRPRDFDTREVSQGTTPRDGIVDT